MSRRYFRTARERLFDKIKAILEGDLDDISKDQIGDTLKDFESLTNEESRDRDVKRAQGLASQAIPHLYRSRGLADPDTPRDLEYYKNMQETRGILRHLKNLLDSPEDEEDE